jgi:hypothetical protein
VSARLRGALLMLAVLLAPGGASAALRGDVDLDNKVDTADVAVLARYVSGEITLSPAALVVADIGPVVNGIAVPDGLVDLRDLVVLSRLVGRQIGPLPPVLNAIAAPGPNQAVQITGTAASGATIQLFVNGEEREMSATATGGSFTFTNVALTAGANDVYAVARLNGLTSGPSNTRSATLQDTAQRNPALNPVGTVVWTPGNTPPYQGAFVINGTLTIASTAKLILAPGTELRFATAASKLVVNGQLLVQGAEGHLAKLTSTGSTARGAWTGIEVLAGSQGSVIRYATIEYAQRGVKISGCAGAACSQATVRRSVIREFSQSGVEVAISCAATIMYNTIDNSAGARLGTGISLSSTAFAWIDSNTDIRGAVTGIAISNSSPTVRANTIRYNNTGISISGSVSNALINAGNVITGNKTGIQTSTLWKYGYPTGQMAVPIINRNAIFDNVWATPPLPAPPELRNFEAYMDQFYTLPINARENWWGTTNLAGIGATILDKADGPTTRPQVDYSSYLDAQGGEPFEGLLTGVLTVNRTLDPLIPYTVIGPYVVQAPAVLTIPAGTTLRFESGAKLRVEGTLDVNGTSANQARFTPLGASPLPGAWLGIEIAGAGAIADIDQALIEYAKTAVSVDQADAVTISNSRIERFKEKGIAMAGVGATALVSGNTIDRLIARDPAVQEVGIDLVDSSPMVTANVIHTTDIGIHIYGNSQPHLGSLGPPLVPGNVISGNGVGVLLEGTVEVGHDPQPVLNRNDIYGNDSWNLETRNFSPGFNVVLDARQNWWGTSDLTAIRAKFGPDAFDEPIAFDLAGYLNGPGGSPAPGSTPAMNTLLHGITPHGGVRAFAPTLGEQARIDFATTLAADVTLEILTERVFDASGQPTIPRVLVATQAQTGVNGVSFFQWNGRDQLGALVPDEAYTYRLTATGGGMTSSFDPGLNPNDGHPVATVPLSYDVYRNDLLDFSVNLIQGSWETAPYPSRATILVEPQLGSPSFTPVVIAEGRPLENMLPSQFVFDGRRADGALITEPDGDPYTSPIRIRSRDRRVMRPNYLIVHRTKPEVQGTAPPKIEVESIPYFVTHSYDQVTRFSFRIDQNAHVEVKMLKPGFGDPDDPNAVLGVLPIVGSPAQPLAAGTPYSVEWRGYAFDTPAANAPANGNYSFAIKATSAVDPAFFSVYRGVVQVRR